MKHDITYTICNGTQANCKIAISKRNIVLASYNNTQGKRMT